MAMTNILYIEDYRETPTDLSEIVRSYQVDSEAVAEAMTVYYGIPHRVERVDDDGPEAA